MAEWVLEPVPQFNNSGISHGSSQVINNEVYFTDGYSTQVKFSFLENKFSDITNRNPRQQYYPGICYDDNNLYVLGGLHEQETSSGIYLLNNWGISRQNLFTRQWEYIYTGIFPYESSSCIVHDELIYTFGGWARNNENTSGSAVSSCRIFDLNTNILTTQGDLPSPGGKTGCGICLVAGKIYLIGGATGNFQSLNNVWNVKADRRTLIYDITTKEFTKGQDCPTDLYYYNSSTSGNPHPPLLHSYDNKIYCIDRNSGAVLFYDILNDAWEYIEAAPYNNTQSITIYNNRLYIFKSNDNVYSYDLLKVYISNLNPASGFIDENKPQTFSWLVTSNSGIIQQKSGTFQWRIKGAAQNTEYLLGADQSITIPAGTFPNGYIEWRVKVVGSNDVESDWTEWLELSTIDLVHGKPTNLIPSSGTKKGTEPRQFSWVVHSSYNTPQKAFQLQYRYTNDADWRDLGVIQSESPSYVFAANTLKPYIDERVTWRVRTYNSDDEPSPWSDEVFFLVVGAPDPPRWISVDAGTARPLCKWFSSGEQFGYQLQVLLGDTIRYDSGPVSGNTMEHRIHEYLENGQYTFRVRIVNKLNIWSEWANYPATISATSTLFVDLMGEKTKHGAFLSFFPEVRKPG